jgi:hypothetical protein
MLTSLPLEPVGDRQNDDRPMVAGVSFYVKGFDSIRSRTRPFARARWVTASETDAPAAAFLSTWEPFPPGMVSATAFRRAVAETPSMPPNPIPPSRSPTALLCRRRYGVSRRRRGYHCGTRLRVRLSAARESSYRPAAMVFSVRHNTRLTADHLTPLALGGDPLGPLLVLCRRCNSRRGSRCTY